MVRMLTVPALEAVPGLVHGFEQRSWPAAGESHEDTRGRVASALARHGRLLLMRQVHGAAVARAPWGAAPSADVALAFEPGWLLGIETADCLPILIVDERRRAAAAVHAGWRGTAAGVAPRALEALGSDPGLVLVAIGPGIGPCCYEVGDELRSAFAPEHFRPGPRGRSHLDVRAANVGQLEAAGVAPARIHHVPDCTACHPDRYHSFRRDGPGSGRMISFVGWRLRKP